MVLPWLRATLFYSAIGLPTLLFVGFVLVIAFFCLRRTRFLKWLVLLALLLVVGPPLFLIGLNIYHNATNTYTHRYRLTVEVETPDGVKRGANVIEVSDTPKMVHWNPSSSGLMTRVWGEAIFLDLGQGKNLVATLGFGPTGANTDKLDSLAAEALGRYKGGFYEEAPSWTGSAELHGNLIPTLVTFANPADPYTVRVVRPEEFEAVFGPGYRFKGAWIEMTRDQATVAGFNIMYLGSVFTTKNWLLIAKRESLG
jgi:hypothetical protein